MRLTIRQCGVARLALLSFGLEGLQMNAAIKILMNTSAKLLTDGLHHWLGMAAVWLESLGLMYHARRCRTSSTDTLSTNKSRSIICVDDIDAVQHHNRV